MNLKKRFMVLDSKNQAVRPKDFGLRLPDMQSDASPSFLALDPAKAFASHVAAANKGENYYVVQTLEAVTAYDELDGTPEKGTRLEWGTIEA